VPGCGHACTIGRTKRRRSQQSFLGTDAGHDAGDPGPTEVCAVAGHIRGSVQLTGAWKGLVEIRLADRLAYEASAGMLMMPVDAVAEADVLDAVKEIANMMAGTIKSSLPRPCAMSLPTSHLAGNAWFGPSNAEDSLVVSFRHPAGNLLVWVLKQDCVMQ
jgi:CheY-specific phosphatase CheX